MSRVHVVGAGLAGLACAVRLTRLGVPVVAYESAGHAGGRCRSLYDEKLERQIDNGNHLVLGGNRHVFAYLKEIGAEGTLLTPPEPAFPFLEVPTGRRWTVRPNPGPIPWWIFSPERRVPGSRALDYLAGARLALSRPEDTVIDRLDPRGPLFERFWAPLAVAVLNTAPEEGSARLLWAVVAETFLRGGEACRPFIARTGLSQTFVEPALAFLKRGDCPLRFGARLRAVEESGNRIAALDFGDRKVRIDDSERVVLALPPHVMDQLLPLYRVPLDSRTIVNAHFRLAAPAPVWDEAPFLGLVGGVGHWIFLRGDIASITVSAGDRLAETANEAIAETLWREAAVALDRPTSPIPPYRIIKERRATLAQTPEALRHRHATRTGFVNLFLAGDWTDTGIPATIEGAVRSGHAAARLAAEA